MITGEGERWRVGLGFGLRAGFGWWKRNGGSIAVENAAQRGGTAEMEDGRGRWTW
jgi:hypothetical protein